MSRHASVTWANVPARQASHAAVTGSRHSLPGPCAAAASDREPARDLRYSVLMSTAAAYGSWRSPITATAIAAGEVPLSQPSIVDGDTYWLEGKPLEGGRIVLVHMSADGSRR